MICGRPCIWLLFFLYLAHQAAAQPTRALPLPRGLMARNIDNSNGLLSNDVQAIARDHEGYVWIGTQKGLQRYDGMRFVDCFPPEMEPQSLNVFGLYTDETRGRILYVLPQGPVMQWRIMSHVSLPIDSASKEAATNYKGDWKIKVLWTDSSKENIQGLALVRAPGKKKEVYANFITPKGAAHTWMVVSDAGLIMLDEQKKAVESIPMPIDPKTIHRISMDSRGNLWMASWAQQFYRYSLPEQKLYSYSLADILKAEGNESTLPAWVSSMLEDDHGKFWLGTGQAGLLCYDYEKDRFQYLLREPGNDQTLQYTDQINAIFQDKESNLWVGTDKGISVLDPYREYFRTLSNQDSSRPSLVKSDIIPVGLIHDELWVGSWGGGIKVYDQDWHEKKQFFFKGKYDQNMVWSMLERSDGSTWVGCQSGIIHVIDANGRTIKTMSPPEAGGRTVKDIKKDARGNLLLGLQSGKIISFDTAQNRFLPFEDSLQPAGYLLSPIENLFRDEHDICWASTYSGLAEYDDKQRRFKGLYQPHPGVDVRCWGVSRYNDSLLLVGTENDGLYFFNRKQRLFYRIPINQERSHGSVHAVAADSLGQIWFTTDHTICHYDPLTGSCFVSQPPEGLLNSGFVGQTFRILPKGEWITWTATEIVSFYPDSLRALEQRPKDVSITGFRVFSSPLYIDSAIAKNSTVFLDSKQNFISIDFCNLQFSGVEHTNYLYRLDQVDTGWVYGGTQGTANYTKLAPGKYTFRVKAENAKDDAGMAVLHFTIAAPFWATWWFRWLVLVIVLLGIFLFLLRRDRRLLKEADIKQRIAKTEMLALRAQMNPHFIFNCINGIDALIQSDDKYRATVYLNRFARLIRNVLDSSNHDTITLTRDLETLQLYLELEKFRSQNRFTTDIRVEPGLLEDDWRVPPMIIQPYVENAIHHGLRGLPGKNGRLLIDIRKEKDFLVYRIEDNGVGRAATAKDKHRRSYGMEMSRDRVNLFNGETHIPVVIDDLEIDGRPAGTRIEVSLKLIV